MALDALNSFEDVETALVFSCTQRVAIELIVYQHSHCPFCPISEVLDNVSESLLHNSRSSHIDAFDFCRLSEFVDLLVC